MAGLTAQGNRAATLRLSMPCDLVRVRETARMVREFLASEGVPEADAHACEAALVEACNNAVQYAQAEGRLRSIELSATCDIDQLEFRITDHTPGFEWPRQIALPEPEAENGRGLFLIQACMDGAGYFRGQGENTLVLKKNRNGLAAVSNEGALAKLKSELADSEQVISGMAKELTSCYETLSAIFRCGAELGKNQNLNAFCRQLLANLLEITAAEWFVLRTCAKDGSQLLLFSASEPLDEPAALLLPPNSRQAQSAELRAALTREDVTFGESEPLSPCDPLAVFKPRSLGLVHPLIFGESLVGTLAVGKADWERPFTPIHVNVVHTFADFLAIQVVTSRFQEEQLVSLLVSRELEIAKNIQLSLLPKRLPEVPGVGLAGFCASARQVGGDFYDVIPLSGEALLLVIADVMGKGIPAAMFAAILRSLVRSVPELTNQPGALMGRVNRLLYDELSGVEMFITAQLVYVDARQRRIITASAGHCPVLLSVATAGAIQTLSPEGMPLGIFPDTQYEEVTAALPPNSRVLLYTDGLTEAHNAQGELFGQERLVRWLKETAHRAGSAEELKSDLAAEISRFQSHSSLRDDQSFLILAT